MPDSIFIEHKSNCTAKTSSYEQLTAARERLISSLVWHRPQGPYHASTIYIWPSAVCPVGCGHCNFAAPRELKNLHRPRIVDRMEAAISLINESELWKAVLSGGGEPMVEPEFCNQFVANVDTKNLREIELITSAYFATDENAAESALRRLAQTWRGRGDKDKVAFTVRLSFDWFHLQRQGLGPAVNTVRALRKPEFQDVGFYIRSVLMDHDDSIERLAAALGATLGQVDDYQQFMTLPGGESILIYYKNLILDGRMSMRKLGRLTVGLTKDSRIAQFEQRFKDGSGRHIPARIYNGPTVKQLDGLACVIEDDASIKILEGNAPKRAPRVGEVCSWGRAMEYLYADPLTAYLVNQGPQSLGILISDKYPDCATVCNDYNQLYYLADRILSTPDRLMYATLKVIAHLQSSGELDVARQDIDLARYELAEFESEA